MSVVSRDGLDWTHDEVVFALGLYFQIPWGKIHQRNPIDGRGAVAWATGVSPVAVCQSRSDRN